MINNSEVLKRLKIDFDNLRKRKKCSFEEIKKEIKKEKNTGGVYVIYRKKKVIYVGSTTKFAVRFRHMLHMENHTLHRKLMNKYGSEKKVKKIFEEECSYRIKKENDLGKRELLEHFAIVVLNPKYNQK